MMSYIVIIIAAIVIALLDDRLRGKKKVPPTTIPGELTRTGKQEDTAGGRFEIPPMRGIPSAQEAHAAPVERDFYEEERRRLEREERELWLHEQERAHRARVQQSLPHINTTGTALPSFTPNSMVQAVILAEILGKPRAMRRFPRH